MAWPFESSIHQLLQQSWGLFHISRALQNNIANTILYHYLYLHYHFNGLVQGRRNSSALAMELRFSYTNQSIFSQTK